MNAKPTLLCRNLLLIIVHPLSLFEVGQDVLPPPPVGAPRLVPLLVVPGAAPDVEHAVEHAGAAQGLAVHDNGTRTPAPLVIPQKFLISTFK